MSINSQTAEGPTQTDIAKDWLRKNPGPRTIKQISEGTGIHYQSTAALVSNMARKEITKRVGAGMYELVPEPATARTAAKAAPRTPAVAKRTAKKAKKAAKTIGFERVPVGANGFQRMPIRSFEVVGNSEKGPILRDDAGVLFLNVPVQVTVDLGGMTPMPVGDFKLG